VQEEIQAEAGQDDLARILIESEEQIVLDRSGLSDYVLFGLRGSKPEGFFVYRHSNAAFLNGCLVGMMSELCLNAQKHPHDLIDGFLTLDSHRDKIPSISYLALSQMEPMDHRQVFRVFIGNNSETLLEFDDVTMYVFMGTGENGPASSFNCDGAFLMGSVAEGADQLAAVCQRPYPDAIQDICQQAIGCLQDEFAE
jgi:hypothetical protein